MSFSIEDYQRFSVLKISHKACFLSPINFHGLYPEIELEKASKTHGNIEMSHAKILRTRRYSIAATKLHISGAMRKKRKKNLLVVTTNGLRPNGDENPTFPDLLLWDHEGLKGFEDITYLDGYYLTHNEIDLLEHHRDAIDMIIKPNSIPIELGSG